MAGLLGDIFGGNGWAGLLADLTEQQGNVSPDKVFKEEEEKQALRDAEYEEGQRAARARAKIRPKQPQDTGFGDAGGMFGDVLSGMGGGAGQVFDVHNGDIDDGYMVPNSMQSQPQQSGGGIGGFMNRRIPGYEGSPWQPTNADLIGATLADMGTAYGGGTGTQLKTMQDNQRKWEMYQWKQNQKEAQRQAKLQHLAPHLSEEAMAFARAGYADEVASEQLANIFSVEKKTTPFGKLDPSKYTPDSIAAFEQSGRYSDLRKPQGGSAPAVTDKDLFGRENTLRDDFRQDTRDFMTTQSQYSLMKDAPETGAGDIGRVFALMKMYDPGSTVREGEQATAQNAAGVPSWIRSQFNQLSGGGTLDAKARAEMLEAGSVLYQKGYDDYAGTANRYTKAAERYGVDPALVGNMDMKNLYTDPKTEAARQEAEFQAYYDSLPSGAQYTGPDGRTRTKP